MAPGIAFTLGPSLASCSSTRSTPTPHAAPKFSTITLDTATYKPHAAPGTTDDYHCTLLDLHVTRDRYLISSTFHPGSSEDHHVVLYLVPPRDVHGTQRDREDGPWSLGTSNRERLAPSTLAAVKCARVCV